MRRERLIRMIEKPNITDEEIISALWKNYLVPAARVKFLPVGNDSSAWAYRVDSEDGSSYFLKIRKGISDQSGLLVPRFLEENGIQQVIAPLETKEKGLWVDVDSCCLILYPFVAGREAMEIGMSDSQWRELGSVLKRIHAIELTADISTRVRHETFVPKWLAPAQELHDQIKSCEYEDPFQRKLAEFWREKYSEIQVLMERAEALGQRVRNARLEFVLCHGDIHTANILISDEQKMFIVDWDDTVIAPKERDLMFVVRGISGDAIGKKEEEYFFKGYGQTQLNILALAYYRYEWCVQEIGDYGQRVFLMTDAGDQTRKDSVAGFMDLFTPRNVVEAAFNTQVEI